MPNILFALLAEANDKPVEILRTGTFIDSGGQEVMITDADLDAFVANFKAGKAGQEVPIDIDHERGEAGGWLVKLERQGSKLLGFVNWNELGEKLVGDEVYKYLSAWVDLQGKFLKSVSLVNFPAIKGLKTIELSEGSVTFQQQGFFDAIREMVQDIVKRDKRDKPGTNYLSADGSGPVSRFTITNTDTPIGINTDTPSVKLSLSNFADGETGTVKISQLFKFGMSKFFNNTVNNLGLSGHISTDEQKEITDQLNALIDQMKLGDAGDREVPSMNFFPQDGFFNERIEEDKPMDKKELAELTERIRAEEQAKAEVNFAEHAAKEAELREKIRSDVEAEVKADLKEKFERRQGFVEFAEKICKGDEAGLSVKPDEIVSLLEQQTEDKAVDALKVILSAKVASFKEIGSNGNGRDKLPALPNLALKEVLTGDMTVQQLFDCSAVDGVMADYDLSALSAKQVGMTL